MTEPQNSTPDVEYLTYVSKQEPTQKAPPRLETGVLLWVRRNLFDSVLNTLLTIFGTILVITALVGIVNWMIGNANWFAISFNFRQLMLGRYEAPYEWRTTLTALFVIFLIGVATAVWVRQIVRVMTGVVAVSLVVLLVLPPLITATISLPPYYVTAGSGAVTMGTVSEAPSGRLAFTGQSGEQIQIRIAAFAAESDPVLSNIAGFLDMPGNTLRNAALNRLAAIDRRAELEDILARDAESEIPLLTAGLRETYTAELESLVIPDVVVETYQINQHPVEVAVLDPVTLEPVADPVVLTTAEDTASFSLPASGWFILQTLPAGSSPDNVFTLLDVRGVYPLLQSASYDTDTGGFVDTFVRMTDNFRVVEPVPSVDGAELPFTVATRNQYRGTRPPGDWLRAYVAPFLQRISLHAVLLIATGAAGYAVVAVLEARGRKATARSLATWLMILMPLIVWIFVNGMYAVTAALWLAVGGLAAYCALLYRIGKAYGRAGWWQTGRLPLLTLLLIAGYAACLLLYFATKDGGLPHYILLLAFIPLLVAAVYGSNDHIPGDEVRLNLPLLLGISGALYAVPLLLIVTGTITGDMEWLLSPSDPRNWGGLLLTFMLTLYGIIAAFPIGVGLALGRRSDLPAVKYLCTAYIELVRGSPFVTVLFFMQLLIPLISQSFAEVPNSYRAMIATIAFSAAYLAENVRGGLQALPPGQTEAAKALGLNAWQMTILITLPQALRTVIPVLVGQFISLFKDTSLVAIVGLIDLTGFVNTMVVQAEFIGTRLEGLFFISMLYFVVSYVMSYISRLLEASGSGSTRRM